MQCRKGWHLKAEPAADRATPSEEHKALLAVQANLVAAYAECREAGEQLGLAGQQRGVVGGVPALDR